MSAPAAAEPAVALHLEGVECGHAEPAAGGARFVLEVDRFVVRRGEAIALAGPSGAGKSTMLALALRPRRAETFTLRTRAGGVLDAAACWRAGDEDGLTAMRAAHLGYVLQQGGLLGFLTVRENIALSQAVLGRRDPARLESIAARLEIAPLLGRMPATLSVGQRQRVAIARALAHGPEIVLAD